MPIKKSLRILLILSSMIPVILASVLSHGLLADKILEENTRHLKLIAQTNISGLSAMITTQKTEVSLLALQNRFIDAAIRSNHKKACDTSQINQILLKRSRSYKSCECISLYNADRKIIASSDPDSIGADLHQQLTLDYIDRTKSVAVALGGLKPMTYSGKTIYTLEIGSPLFDPVNNNIIGYVISTVGTSYFNDFLSKISVGTTGFGILLLQDGTVIYHPQAQLIGHNINSKKLSRIVYRYKKGLIPSGGDLQCTYQHTRQVYGYCILPELNWLLLVKQDVSEIESSASIILVMLFILCTGFLILVIIFSNILAKKFTAPLIMLRDAMRLASEGNLTAQSCIKSNNELGELSKNFNKMLHIIKTNYEELESMHRKLLSNEEQLRTNYDRIEFLAYHDTLTGLPNKLAFLDYVNTILSSAQPGQTLHAVYFIDLDNFKIINDTLGHEYGDALLAKIAQILGALMKSDDMLARAGGDEFLIFCEKVSSRESAVDYASQIIKGFKGPIDLSGEIVYVSMSIGISIYPENGLSSRILIKNADIAMYHSKDTGKNKYSLFDTKMEEELNRNTLILEVLRNAIDRRELYLQYQPQYDLSTNTVIGFEALMRIKNDRLGKISPSEFIPIAEESGLIAELGSWLILEACSFAKVLIDQGLKPRPVSVNISTVQMNRPGFVPLLSDILSKTQLPPQYLELEITESTLVSSILDAAMLLCRLQGLGVKISLDDFGTGYSSLNYLTRMPINTLKIDKSFIDHICTRNKDCCIADSIIQLAHSLNIRVIAEGVEYAEQLELLREQDCDIVQGFIYSRPLYPSELLDLIREEDYAAQYHLP